MKKKTSQQGDKKKERKTERKKVCQGKNDNKTEIRAKDRIKEDDEIVYNRKETRSLFVFVIHVLVNDMKKENS